MCEWVCSVRNTRTIRDIHRELTNLNKFYRKNPLSWNVPYLWITLSLSFVTQHVQRFQIQLVCVYVCESSKFKCDFSHISTGCCATCSIASTITKYDMVGISVLYCRSFSLHVNRLMKESQFLIGTNQIMIHRLLK